MKPIDVLFLCESNAAASLMAEAWVMHSGDPRLRAFSAGRQPADVMLPEARAVLSEHAVAVDGLEPKALSIFALPGAPRPDLIVDLATVTWTDPEIAALAGGRVLRWPLRDPATVDRAGGERRAVTEAIFRQLRARIDGELARLVNPLAPGSISPFPDLLSA